MGRWASERIANNEGIDYIWINMKHLGKFVRKSFRI